MIEILMKNGCIVFLSDGLIVKYSVIGFRALIAFVSGAMTPGPSIWSWQLVNGPVTLGARSPFVASLSNTVKREVLAAIVPSISKIYILVLYCRRSQ